MGTIIHQRKDGKFVVESTFDDSKSKPVTRAGAILMKATGLSPHDLIREFYTFPEMWSCGGGRAICTPDREKNNAAHMEWLHAAKTSADVWKKYRECLAELKRQSEEGGDDIDFGV